MTIVYITVMKFCAIHNQIWSIKLHQIRNL